MNARPRLEALEGRDLPAPVLPPVLGPGLVRPGGPQVDATLRVVARQDAPPGRIDLGATFAAMPGLRAADGLALRVLGNTNPGLVAAGLSETMLTLTYAPGKSGAATVTVCATDMDGVSRTAGVIVRVFPALETEVQ